METIYFENDGSFFRGRAGLGAVEDIWMGDQWEPYKGDCARRYLFGNKVELANLPIAAGGEGRCPANVRYYKDGEARAEARAEALAEEREAQS
jgi:hypothetical protein